MGKQGKVLPSFLLWRSDIYILNFCMHCTYLLTPVQNSCPKVDLSRHVVVGRYIHFGRLFWTGGSAFFFRYALLYCQASIYVHFLDNNTAVITQMLPDWTNLTHLNRHGTTYTDVAKFYFLHVVHAHNFSQQDILMTTNILKLILFSEEADQNFSIIFPINVTQNSSNYFLTYIYGSILMHLLCFSITKPEIL
jgi:hypothetical protein